VRPLLPLLLALALASACAPTHGAVYPGALAEGERAECAGRFLEARDHYDAAARGAVHPRDAHHARFLAALAAVHSGDVVDGLARLDALAQEKPAGEHSAEAAYLAADLRISRGSEDRGWRDLDAFVHDFPSSGVAHRALERLVAYHDEREGKAWTLDYLVRVEQDLGQTEIGELAAFEAAEERASLGDKAAARDAFLDVAARWPYPYGALWDDALWRASELDEELGRYDAAVADLERMLREHEQTTILGNYQRPRMSPAAMRIADLYAGRLHDRARARDAYHRYYTDFPTSLGRDTALWKEAALWKEDGDVDRACSRLSTLVGEFPDSRYVPCAVESCKGLERAKGSHAPAECHAYLTR
jgi:outer membrane protein assembly factor BamD (BamD/ComL family)